MCGDIWDIGYAELLQKLKINGRKDKKKTSKHESFGEGIM
jgi:hypothetical protein